MKGYCVFAANYVWPAKNLGRETLVLVIRLEYGQEFNYGLREAMLACNRRLPDYKRVGAYLVWSKDFPRTASMKIKRTVLASEIGKSLDRAAVVAL